MSRRSLIGVVVVCLAILASALPTHAQNATGTIVSTIPFEFMVGDQAFPSGEYRISRQSKSETDLQIRSADGKFQSALTPITRLGRQHVGDAPKASLVFDKVDEKHYLSEVWILGQDGYLLRGTKDGHQHEVVEVK